ncbi:hypothetical protein B0H12DRAFT_1082907 [Mycena haematopus]|nr:hypothetical protein B0H12DRAFT_1082907 [Mycena haematopus]
MGNPITRNADRRKEVRREADLSEVDQYCMWEYHRLRPEVTQTGGSRAQKPGSDGPVGILMYVHRERNQKGSGPGRKSTGSRKGKIEVILEVGRRLGMSAGITLEVKTGRECNREWTKVRWKLGSEPQGSQPEGKWIRKWSGGSVADQG